MNGNDFHWLPGEFAQPFLHSLYQLKTDPSLKTNSRILRRVNGPLTQWNGGIGAFEAEAAYLTPVPGVTRFIMYSSKSPGREKEGRSP